MKYIFLLPAFLLLACPSDRSKGRATPADTVHTRARDTPVNSRNPDILLHESPHVRVHGRSSAEDDIRYVERKFEPYVGFGDFPALKTSRKAKAPINYASDPVGSRYRTAISNTYESTDADFAGHYVFVMWRCGSLCWESAIVDVSDGSIYPGPEAANLYSYRTDSRLLVVNPPDSSGFVQDLPDFNPELWVWEEKGKAFRQLAPGGLSGERENTDRSSR